MLIYTYTCSCRIHTDAINWSDAVIYDAGRLLYKNIYLSLYCEGSKRVTQGLHVRGSWRPNTTEIFWPQSYGRQRCVFLVLQGYSTWALESTMLGAGFPYYTSPFSDSNSTQLSSFCSIRRPYITFKLPRGDMDTPPQFLSISGDRDVSLPLSLEWPVWSSSSGNNCHAVQRSLSSGASVYESIMGFFLPRPFHQPISAHAISSHNCH